MVPSRHSRCRPCVWSCVTQGHVIRTGMHVRQEEQPGAIDLPPGVQCDWGVGNDRHSWREFNLFKLYFPIMIKQLFLSIVVAVVAVALWDALRERPIATLGLVGKRVVVCGASTGIGEQMALQYASAGAKVFFPRHVSQ